MKGQSAMTIKDMEARTGMSRANIRYYEQEGLIAPQRDSNGYRNYQESDVQALERILLMRRLGAGGYPGLAGRQPAPWGSHGAPG